VERGRHDGGKGCRDTGGVAGYRNIEPPVIVLKTFPLWIGNRFEAIEVTGSGNGVELSWETPDHLSGLGPMFRS
jgi:hypothetical protein